MSEQDTTQVDDAPEAEEATTEETTEAAEEQPTEDSTDWRRDFDPEKAREKITKLNSENKNLRQRAKNAESGAGEKDSRISDLETALARERVGRRLGLPDQLVDRLKGSTEEELLADAQALVDLVSPKATVKKRPTERLAGGGEPEEEPEENDPAKLAAAIRAARG